MFNPLSQSAQDIEKIVTGIFFHLLNALNDKGPKLFKAPALVSCLSPATK
jgi:hypothetical protein